MNFPDKFQQIIERTAPERVRTLWTKSFVVAFAILMCCIMYITLQAGWDALVTVNRAVANTAMILIGLSFIASSLCSFWNFFDKQIIYRKYWGLLGFWYACLHGLISLAQKDFDLGFFLLPQNIVAFISAVIAFVILTMMALISNNFGPRTLGGKRWRAALRVGYVAYVFAIIHLVMKAFPQWETAIATGNSIPPISIPVTAFGIVVIIMRLVLAYALYCKKCVARKALKN